MSGSPSVLMLDANLDIWYGPPGHLVKPITYSQEILPNAKHIHAPKTINPPDSNDPLPFFYSHPQDNMLHETFSLHLQRGCNM